MATGRSSTPPGWPPDRRWCASPRAAMRPTPPSRRRSSAPPSSSPARHRHRHGDLPYDDHRRRSPSPGDACHAEHQPRHGGGPRLRRRHRVLRRGDGLRARGGQRLPGASAGSSCARARAGKGPRCCWRRPPPTSNAPRIGDQTGGRVFLFLHTDDFERDHARFLRPAAVPGGAEARAVRDRRAVRGPLREPVGSGPARRLTTSLSKHIVRNMCCHPELLHHLVAGHVQDLHNDAERHRRADPCGTPAPPPPAPPHRLAARRSRLAAGDRPAPGGDAVSPRGDTPKPRPKRPQRPTRVAREENPRRLTDARTMRAIAHPVRVALLEALTREGPLTATEASELIGESPANCSFHLRTLAKYGFVEEAEGGTGRNRPWQRVSLGMSFETVHDDAEMSMAASVLADGLNEHVFELWRRWSASRREYPAEWQSAAFTDTRSSTSPPTSCGPSNSSCSRSGSSIATARWTGASARPTPGRCRRDARPPAAAEPVRQLVCAVRQRLRPLTPATPAAGGVLLLAAATAAASSSIFASDTEWLAMMRPNAT